MKKTSFTIKDPDGIHARPAGILVKRMQEFPCTIVFEKGDKRADGKKLFAVMKMAVKQGDELVMTADGEREDEAVAVAEAVFRETGL
ncbi:MAG: HPr family phosphocarrier protein [Clostridiales Family XIII bacterium]|jgi:phosphocarrier protein|nr:HPr family phosphocarrier protein [Clostridiales Family XIII bacterium]